MPIFTGHVRLSGAGSTTITLPQLYTLLLTSLSSLLKDFPVAQIVKNLPAMQETRVWSLGREDPLEKEIHSSILAWRIPRTEKSGGLQCVGLQSQARLSDQHTPSSLFVTADTGIMKLWNVEELFSFAQLLWKVSLLGSRAVIKLYSEYIMG